MHLTSRLAVVMLALLHGGCIFSDEVNRRFLTDFGLGSVDAHAPDDQGTSDARVNDHRGAFDQGIGIERDAGVDTGDGVGLDVGVDVGTEDSGECVEGATAATRPECEWTWLQISEPADRRGLMVFGGSTSSTGAFDNQSWEWNERYWREFTGPLGKNPTQRINAAMATNSLRNVAILFGGKGPTGLLNDTWQWNGWQWRHVLPPSPLPPPRSGHTMGYIRARDGVILFGGKDVDGLSISSPWEWNGSSWQRITSAGPSRRHDHAMADDIKKGLVVVFGGRTDSMALDDTWLWTTNGSWVRTATTTISPPARYEHAIAHDERQDGGILFGGRNQFGALLQDTWRWSWMDGTLRWQNVTPVRPEDSAPARAGHALAYANSFIYLFGGVGQSGQPLDDVWRWTGSTWQEVTPAQRPGARTDFAFTVAHWANPLVGYGKRIDGSIWGFAPNRDILGLEDGRDCRPEEPCRLDNVSNWPTSRIVEVDSDGDTSCGLTERAEVYCWGLNDRKQVGRLETLVQRKPYRVAGVSDAGEVSTNAGSTCALLRSGGISCWGDGRWGRLGDGVDRPLNETTSMPVDVLIQDAVDVAVGRASACAVTSSLSGSKVLCWGSGSNIGRLGTGVSTEGYTEFSPAEVAIPAGSSTLEVQIGVDGATARLSSGRMMSWGPRRFGRLGTSTAASGAVAFFPEEVVGISDSVDVARNGFAGCAIKSSDRRVYCWGRSNYHGSTASSDLPTPAKIDLDLGFEAIWAHSSSQHVCGKTVASGQMYCWGFAVGPSPKSIETTPTLYDF